MIKHLTFEERKFLLGLARVAIDAHLNNKTFIPIKPEELSEALLEHAASFVTLTKDGQLRGCVGGLEPKFPLYQDVYTHAIAAATQDFRFGPLQSYELPQIQIEISRLSLPRKLYYKDPDELIRKLCPYRDGVVIQHGARRATFLPQVWKKIPDPNLFLDRLCEKLGCAPDIWRFYPLEISVYLVEEFNESEINQSRVMEA